MVHGGRWQQKVHWFPFLGTRAEGSEVERVDKMWSGRWPGLEKGERRVWGHHDTRVVGAERQIKKESTNAGKW